MAPKVPKKPMKSMEKLVEKPISKTKKKTKKNFTNFSIYVYKILRSLSGTEIGITRKSMIIMNSFVHDMLEKIATEASRFTMLTKKHTLSSTDIQSAVKLVVPGELFKHANAEGLKAVTLYHNSQDS